MTFNIDNVDDIEKLVGALHLRVKGKFLLSKEVASVLFDRLSQFAKEGGIVINVHSYSDDWICTSKTVITSQGSLTHYSSNSISNSILSVCIFTGSLFTTCVTLILRSRKNYVYLQTV